jgi:hypothetical protein
MKLITDNEDIHMNALDLAFLLATHNLDATPKDGYVIVKQDGKIYSLTPNGEKPGLAEIGREPLIGFNFVIWKSQ